ncbi:hypothetical protein RB614_14605 [Phytohabitans sp. ZYX-F-186]|uniref:O-antigen polysaccharide polymerase Wzy n=1 Tax=Phytohabitans maris TaxID=3071409 RepID=A0ABU0ZHB9_9ACTN|nr:hypothetical protein [Phytohabitans sp. ZYX-F-186]MDQ7905747.1 hypothetical protein [Phytohabitans sp. ZYX-F-186]
MTSPFADARHLSAALSATVVPAASLVLAVVDPRLGHWFLVPVTVCGVLVGVDVVDWLRRRRDVLDPQALVGLLGLHFFYLAPILHVLCDYWMRESFPAGDWRDALGAMALLNAAGLAVYRAVLAVRPRRGTRAMLLRQGTFYAAGLAAVAVGVGAFAVEVALLGGWQGFVSTMTGNRADLEGLGWVLIVAESFPLVAFALVTFRWREVLARHPALVPLLLLVFAAAQFVVSGARGSRNNTVWPVLAGLILVHYLVRQVRRRTLVGFALVFVTFMYAYGLYKGAGTQVLDIARGQRTVAEISDRTGRDLPTMLLGDLARADVQALVLERIRTGQAAPAMGATYLTAPAFAVPQWLAPDPPPGKVEAGTDAIFGSGAYEAGLRSSRVYGITGEAVLNFGPLGGLLSFALFGLVVRAARRFCTAARSSPDLARRLLAPSVTVIAISALSWDADNLVWFCLKHVMPLAAVVLVAVGGGRERPAPSTVAAVPEGSRR